jgi:NAD(P)-dependent dehydrogenase (short-subunit alcohol dehydrogenase family)
MVGRDQTRTERAVAEVRAQSGNHNVTHLLADLSEQAQVRRLADEFRERSERLDVLVNNAGAAFLRRQLSADGLEMTLALNHLAYFLLTNLLLDTLKASAPARVVNVSSGAHRNAQMDFEDLELRGGYGALRAYGRSKLANVLFTYELARRLEGSGVTANVVHPGWVATNIGRNNGWWMRPLMALIQRSAMPPEKGAETVVHLASDPELEGVSGRYFVKLRPVRSSPASYDEQAAQRLWEVSARLTGLAA